MTQVFKMRLITKDQTNFIP